MDPACATPPPPSRGSMVMPAASRQSGQRVFFNAGRQATLFTMGLKHPSPSKGPTEVPNVPTQGGQALLWWLRGKARMEET